MRGTCAAAASPAASFWQKDLERRALADPAVYLHGAFISANDPLNGCQAKSSAQRLGGEERIEDP
jgi:hypothetical protein